VKRSIQKVLIFKETQNYLMVECLRGKVVWITGPSSGIGEYLAYRLVQAGCKLVLSARREEELKRVQNTCIGMSKLQVVTRNALLIWVQEFLPLIH